MDLDSLLSSTFLITWLTGAVRMAGPLMLAATGEIVAERSGVLNVGIEGTLLLGALASFMTATGTGNPWLGLAAAGLAGLLANLFLAWMYVTVQASQVVVGILFNSLALGLTAYIHRLRFGSAPVNGDVPMLPAIDVPALSGLPVVGPVLFAQPVMFHLTLVVVLVTGHVLYRTRLGLDLRAAGENPHAAAAAGIRVSRMRYLGTLASGATAGFAGAYLVLSQVGFFRDNIVSGQGFLALAIVILGRWNPYAAAIAALGFGAADALPLSLQMLDLALPSQLLLAIPYLLATLAMSGLLGRVSQPAALMRPFSRE